MALSPEVRTLADLGLRGIDPSTTPLDVSRLPPTDMTVDALFFILLLTQLVADSPEALFRMDFRGGAAFSVKESFILVVEKFVTSAKAFDSFVRAEAGILVCCVAIRWFWFLGKLVSPDKAVESFAMSSKELCALLLPSTALSGRRISVEPV
jgi:hypothetical protein